MLWQRCSVLIAVSLLFRSVQAQNECFGTKNQLKIAIEAYLMDNSSDTTVAMTYGWPIGTWCVGDVQDFSEIFAQAIGFNEPLNDWVRTLACGGSSSPQRQQQLTARSLLTPVSF